MNNLSYLERFINAMSSPRVAATFILSIIALIVAFIKG